MKANSFFQPGLFHLFRGGYNWPKFGQDLLAGVIVGIVALPLSIAFAVASGVKPEQGIITAIVAGFLISVFSGSRFQVGGPTGAFIVIIYSIVQKHGYDGLVLATVMAGVLLVVMGIARLGDVIKYIPYPVTVGFTGGIAVVIFTSQIRDFTGLYLDPVPEHFLMKWQAYVQHAGLFDHQAVMVGVVTLAILMFWPKVTRRIPGPLVAIMVCTIWVSWAQWPVETIGTRFGAVEAALPQLNWPRLSWGRLAELTSSALAIAVLAGVESLLSAVVADGMTGKRHHSNTELIAQGVANIVSPLLGGIPATGAIARTATSIKNGAQSAVAGIVHAVTILIIFIFCGRWAAYIPMATLAGILIMVAYHMGEWHLFAKMRKSPLSDILVLAVTFLLTVLVDLTVAIEVGVVLAAFLFMRRMAAVTEFGFVAKDGESVIPEDSETSVRLEIPSEVEIFEIQGPFFFGAASKFKDTLTEWERLPKILILRMRYVPTIDATGLQALEELVTQTQREGGKIILSGVRASLRRALQKSGMVDRVGTVNIVPHINDALARARDILGS
jgi:SulP family sulfate permease